MTKAKRFLRGGSSKAMHGQGEATSQHSHRGLQALRREVPQAWRAKPGRAVSWPIGSEREEEKRMVITQETACSSDSRFRRKLSGTTGHRRLGTQRPHMLCVAAWVWFCPSTEFVGMDGNSHVSVCVLFFCLLYVAYIKVRIDIVASKRSVFGQFV